MGIYAKNREEWTMTDLACSHANITTVALYDTLGPEALEYAINQTMLETVACAGLYVGKLAELVKAGRVPSLKQVISFDKPKDEDNEKALDAGLNVHLFSELVEIGKTSQTDLASQGTPTVDSIYMFCYTSGTTGTPKAAKLSHGNLLSVVAACKAQGIKCNHEDVIISYLPLAHSFEKLLFAYSLCFGLQIGYYSGDP